MQRAGLAALSALASGGEEGFPSIIDSEGLGAQILALVHQVFDRYRRADIGAAAVGVIADTQGDRPLQQELQAKAEVEARAAFGAIVDQGKALGLIRPDGCADTLFDMIVGTTLYRALFSLEPAPADYAERVTRMVIDSLSGRPA